MLHACILLGGPRRVKKAYTLPVPCLDRHEMRRLEPAFQPVILSAAKDLSSSCEAARTETTGDPSLRSG